MRKALEGIKVIQLANFIAAAATGRYLADHGADVIIVEAAKGDPIRFTQEQEGRPQNIKENVCWEYLNGNKRCISINTKTEEGKEALFALLEDADVLLTNWRLGALQRAGLDYETLKVRFPKLIYAMILGYGNPITMIPGLGDNNVGLMLAMGIVTALFNREKTGQGDFVTTSLYETAIFNMSMMLLGVQYDGQAHDYPISIYDNMNPLNGAYRTSDDRIIQCACPNYNDRFEPFMKSIGREDLIEAGKYFPQADMIAAGLVRELIDEIQKTFLEGDMKTMDDKLRAGDIPHSIAYSWEDIMNDPQAHAVGAFYDVTCPNGVVRKATHTPVRLESEGEIDGRTAPMIGEQGREVLKEVGYSDEKIESMLENGTLYIWKDEE